MGKGDTYRKVNTDKFVKNFDEIEWKSKRVVKVDTSTPTVKQETPDEAQKG